MTLVRPAVTLAVPVFSGTVQYIAQYHHNGRKCRLHAVVAAQHTSPLHDPSCHSAVRGLINVRDSFISRQLVTHTTSPRRSPLSPCGHHQQLVRDREHSLQSTLHPNTAPRRTGKKSGTRDGWAASAALRPRRLVLGTAAECRVIQWDAPEASPIRHVPKSPAQRSA